MAVGCSRDPDEADAVAEALAQAQSQLDGETPGAAIVFAGADYEHEVLLSEVARRFPDVAIVGCVADGQMSSAAGFVVDAVTVTLLASDVVDFRSGLGTDVSADPAEACRQAVRAATRDATQEPALAFAFTDLLQTDLSQVVSSLSAELGSGVPVVGGASAAEDIRAVPWKSHQFHGTEVLEDSLSVLVLSGPLKYSVAIAHGWTPTGKAGTVTQAERNKVAAIDDQTVIDYYRGYLGDDLEFLWGNPLAVYEPGREGFILRAVTASDDETGVSSFMGEVPQGSTVQVSSTSVEQILQAAQTSVDDARARFPGERGPEAGFIVSCAVRQMMLGSRAPLEFGAVQDALGDGIPLSGFYAWAEIGPLEGTESRLHNATFVTLLLGT
ncbi:MAG: FIST signal transduction protein [Chloroflexota bacterium]